MDKLNICWWGNNGNWGDELNPVLCNKISGKYIERVDINDVNSNFRYYCIGSILQTIKSDNFEVWGTGFISQNSVLKFKPNKIHSVRGPLTRDLLIRQGIECPEIYGDPALLYPLFYKPIISKKYKYGLIPHYIDFDSELVTKLKSDDEIKIIDIRDKTINNFIDQISECETILSSSLHGIIASDSYGISSHWIELSKNVQGGGFKFKDYFSSVKRPLVDPIIISKDDNIKSISKKIQKYEIDIDIKSILSSCPFNSLDNLF